MKKILLIAALLLLPLGVMAQGGKPIYVILIGGQSNASGQGMVANIPASFKMDKSVLFYYSQYLKGSEGSQKWGRLCGASESADKFGVELSLGTRYAEVYPDRKVAIIKHALSGSNLYSQWNPGNREGEEQGEEYTKFITTVQEALQKLRELGYTPIIQGMAWQQGEADARDVAGMDNSRAYGTNLRNFILAVREDLDAPDMKFVYGEVIPIKAKRFTGREFVRQGQWLVSEGSYSELSVEGAYLVEGDDLQMKSSDFRTPVPLDDVHLGTFGVLTLGERFAMNLMDLIEIILCE